VSYYLLWFSPTMKFAADFAEKTLFKLIMVKLLRDALSGSTEYDMPSLLKDAFLRVDQQLIEAGKLLGDKSGNAILCFRL
jgi:hypothetical protein